MMKSPKELVQLMTLEEKCSLLSGLDFWHTKPVERFEQRIGKKSETVKKYRAHGLFVLVALPLPGTGAWTGSLVAAALNMRLRDALVSIFCGVLTAGAVMTAVSYGLFA